MEKLNRSLIDTDIVLAPTVTSRKSAILPTRKFQIPDPKVGGFRIKIPPNTSLFTQHPYRRTPAVTDCA